MMQNKNVENERKTVFFNVSCGIIHPDPNHLGSRVFYLGAKIETYNLHHIVISVKESKLTEMIDYVEKWASERNVEFRRIEVQ